MRKILCLTAVTLCLCLLLVGCGARAEGGNNGTTTTATTKEFITEAEAIAIAEQHFGIKNGTIDEKTGFQMAYQVMTPTTSGITTYRIALRWLVTVDGVPSNWSTLDTVEIDAKTGAVLTIVA